MKRLFVGLLALAVTGAGAWAVATRVESPDQVAARAEPPDPVPVVASLTRGYLNGPVSMSTVAVQQQVVAVTPPTALTGVVTAAERAVGDTLSSGSVLLRVDSRPLFVLSGTFPLYRDIQPGDSGDDVAAIQAALREAGYSVGHDGVYGAWTQAAIRAMYRAAGYVAPEAAPVAAPVAPQPAAADSGDTDGAATPTSAPVAPTSAGPVVLRSEVMMVFGLPAAVQAVAPVSTQLKEDTALVTLGSGGVVLSATVPTESLGVLVVGAVAAFTDDAGAAGTATVTAMIPTSDGAQTAVVVTPSSAVTIGKAYLLTIGDPAAEGGESLLAPVAGVVSRGGRSYVYSRDGDVFREVEVTVTGSVGGVAAIVPVSPDVPLDEGVEIRVG